MYDQERNIELLKSGDQQAFSDLVEEYQQFVFTTCLGMVHDKDDADDLCQDVFIECHRSIHTFRAEAKLSSWLCRIAINKSLNFLKKKKRKNFIQRMMGGDEEKCTDACWDIDLDVNDETLKIRIEAVYKAIDTLSKNQRTAFVLCKYDEMSYKEIAEVMGISISSVESLLFRARKSLQKKLLSIYKGEA